LNWTRAQQGNIPFEPEQLNLNDICDEMLKTLTPVAKEKNIGINCLFWETLNVFADRSMLRTVLRNLVTNAIKFTNKGGTINIHAEQNRKNVSISIKDNGIGIPSDILLKLFDISEKITNKGTSGETGTGLGLLLAKNLWKNMVAEFGQKVRKGKVVCSGLHCRIFSI